eukprot:Platyproteum_vivax@DN8837_c0_g1_i1.p1
MQYQNFKNPSSINLPLHHLEPPTYGEGIEDLTKKNNDGPCSDTITLSFDWRSDVSIVEFRTVIDLCKVKDCTGAGDSLLACTAYAHHYHGMPLWCALLVGLAGALKCIHSKISSHYISHVLKQVSSTYSIK